MLLKTAPAPCRQCWQRLCALCHALDVIAQHELHQLGQGLGAGLQVLVAILHELGHIPCYKLMLNTFEYVLNTFEDFWNTV